MSRKSDITAAILAGGKSRRFGRDKALLCIEGEPLFLRIVNVFRSALGTEPLLIGREKLQGYERCFPDIIPDLGPIGGLYTSLRLADTGFVFVSACDMPFIKRELVEYMVEILDREVAVLIPRLNNSNIEPLCAIYNRKLVNKIEYLVSKGDLRMRSLLLGEKVQFVSESEIVKFDPELISFVNVNSKSDLMLSCRLSK